MNTEGTASVICGPSAITARTLTLPVGGYDMELSVILVWNTVTLLRKRLCVFTAVWRAKRELYGRV